MGPKYFFTISSKVSSIIKSKPVRFAVIEALKNLTGSFEFYCLKNKTPPNGLVMLAGVINNKDDKDDTKYKYYI